MSMFTAEYQDFKREDPTVLVKVTLYDDQKNVIKPVISKAKLVQGTKYAGDYEITQDGDQYCLSTKQIAKLPSGSYGMELWGDDGSIYPSAGFIPIRIHRNADDSLEKTKPTIDLDSIIEDLHKAGLNVVFDKIEMLDSNQPASVTSSVRDGKNHITLKIPRGIKGDTGATGPQGPKGPKGDKGDMDLSQITVGGRNLLVGTRNFDGEGWHFWNGVFNQSDFQGLTSVSNAQAWAGAKFINSVLEKQGKLISTSTQYVLSAWVNNTGTSAVDIYLNSAEIDSNNQKVTTLPANSGWVRIASKPFRFTKTTGLSDQISFNASTDVQGGVLKQAGLKLEIGNVATDWTPAPEDAPSNDSQLVHKTGNETIAGDKEFVGNTTLATTTILAGNYGLRVTTSGIQKTTDGKTWVPANI